MTAASDHRWRRTAQFLARGELVPARALLQTLHAEEPGDCRTHLLAAQLAWREDRVRDAVAESRQAAALVPDQPVSLCAVVEALLRAGEVVAARECLARPVLAEAGDAALLMRLADYRQRLDEHAAALELTGRAIAAGAAGPRVRFHHGMRLYFTGRIADAETELAASLAAEPALGRAALALARLRKAEPDDHHLALFHAGLEHVARGTRDHAALEFACYKELEDLGRDAEAWDALARGNAIMHARRPDDSRRRGQYIERMLATCGAERVAACGDVDAGPQPIFILGMPRSGTTVLERMLANHPEVASAGELVDFGRQLHWLADTANTRSERFLARLPALELAEAGRRYLAQTRWRAGGKRFFIDKQPPNWALAGLIHAALPGARILHLVRDPMDTCFSNWRAFFGDAYPYSYDLDTLAACHQGYRRLLAHWHRVMPGAILDVSYAELVREPEASLRRVTEFCGLPWVPGCSDPSRNATPVATLSAAQVRAPLHTRAFGEWRRYREPLEPLRAALGAD